MGDRDALHDWKAFEARSIPTKGIKLPPLFEEALKAAQAEGKQAANALQILELGCGCGKLAQHLSEQGHTLVGVDVNESAIALAQERNNYVDRCRFFVDDVTTFRISNYANHDGVDQHFDFCILQLLLSIVGNVAKRCQTITTAYHSLKKGGYIYLSCSGVSDTINSNYKQLYERDYPATQEMYTYYSRGANIDNILYSTHHFTVNEITKLLKEGGFVDVHVQEIQERSSRRPEEVANFLYAMARKP